MSTYESSNQPIRPHYVRTSKYAMIWSGEREKDRPSVVYDPIILDHIEATLLEGPAGEQLGRYATYMASQPEPELRRQDDIDRDEFL